jgi:hypothetical protein
MGEAHVGFTPRRSPFSNETLVNFRRLWELPRLWEHRSARFQPAESPPEVFIALVAPNPLAKTAGVGVRYTKLA